MGVENESDKEGLGSTTPRSDSVEVATKTKKAGRLFRDMQSSTEAASERPVWVMRKEKECHITIDKFQLSKVAKAIRDILDFQEEEEETTVRIQKVLGRNLKEHLRLIYSITHAVLAKMDMSTCSASSLERRKCTPPSLSTMS